MTLCNVRWLLSQCQVSRRQVQSHDMVAEVVAPLGAHLRLRVFPRDSSQTHFQLSVLDLHLPLSHRIFQLSLTPSCLANGL